MCPKKAIMKASQIKWIAVIFGLLTALVFLHQYVLYGKIFELSDIHHETFILMFASIALISVIILKVRRR